MTWKQTWQALAIILVLGAGMRLVNLGTNSFVADEFLDINSAYGYRMTGEWKAWDFNFGAPATMNENAARDERAFVYKWQVAAWLKFLPPTEAAARMVSVGWGLISIVVLFWSAWMFTRRRDVSLLAAFLGAISVSMIVQSRRLRMYAMFFSVYLAAMTAWYAFYEAEYRGKLALFKQMYQRYQVHLGYLFLALPLTALAFLTHQLAGHLALTLALYLLVRSIGTRGLVWTKNKYQLSLLGGGVLVALLAVVAPKVITAFTRGLVFFDDHFGYIDHAFRDFATIGIGILLTAFGVWYLRVREKRAEGALYLAIAFLLPLLMAIFMWNRNVGAQYIFFVQSFILIAAAVGVMGLFESITEKWGLSHKMQLAVLTLTLVLLIPNWGYFLEENNTYHETSTGGNPNYRKVFTYFKKEQRPTDVLITRNFRNYYWSGARVPVFDFGGEVSNDKLTLDEVKAQMNQHPTGWLIYSSNDEDYIASDVVRFAEQNMERVSNAQVRGDISVFRWAPLETKP